MSKKYEFTGKEKKILGLTFKQIVCVPAAIGGRIESESILDHVRVYGNAPSGDAWVSDGVD